MLKNVGTMDRTIRLALGLLLVGIGFYFKHWIGFVGLVPIVTGMVNWCPLYTLFGIRTCPADKNA